MIIQLEDTHTKNLTLINMEKVATVTVTYARDLYRVVFGMGCKEMAVVMNEELYAGVRPLLDKWTKKMGLL